MADEIENGAEELWDSTRQQLAAYLRGDPSAAARLFRVHRTFLLRKAKDWLDGTVLAESMTEEDLVDEVLLRALDARFFREFRAANPGALRAALAKMLSRTAVDLVRKASAVKRKPTGRPAQPPDQTPTSQVRATELIELCHRILPKREWDVWRWSAIEGLDSGEIARLTGDTDAAVRGLLLRARGRILEALAGENEVSAVEFNDGDG